MPFTIVRQDITKLKFHYPLGERCMHKIVIQRMPAKGFDGYSLDDFVRHQVVPECWRNVDGEWKLLPISFTEDWGLDKCREEAEDILKRAGRDLIAFIAFQNDQVVGYITVNTRFMGSRQQYLQLEAFQVSGLDRCSR